MPTRFCEIDVLDSTAEPIGDLADFAAFRERLVGQLAPLIAAIIRQGNGEGTFMATSPDETARVLVSLIQAANQVATELFIARQQREVSFDAVERTLTAYTEAYERILGIPAGSLALDRPTLLMWFG